MLVKSMKLDFLAFYPGHLTIMGNNSKKHAGWKKRNPFLFGLFDFPGFSRHGFPGFETYSADFLCPQPDRRPSHIHSHIASPHNQHLFFEPGFLPCGNLLQEFCAYQHILGIILEDG